MKDIIRYEKKIFHSQLAARMKRDYMHIYCSLMKISLIALEPISIKKKIKLLLEYLCFELKAFDMGLVAIAIRYFNIGQRLTFFGKIQRGRDDVIESLRNMSWDVFHLKQQQLTMGFSRTKESDITNVLFCSVDKRLYELQKHLKLKMIAFDQRNKNIHLFYEVNELKKFFIKEELDKYFNVSSIFKRLDDKSHVNYDNIATKMEEEILRQFRREL